MAVERVAIVTPRCHPEVVGGAESLAWQYARMLSSEMDVEILTSRATDADVWQNRLPEGKDQREGVRVQRFSSAPGHGLAWRRLHEWLSYRDRLAQRERLAESVPDWSLALQEEWIRGQGPDCPGLYDWLERAAQESRYGAALFIPYLFPTTYFGLQVFPPARCILAPALHDEAAARLPVLRRMARRVARLFWNTRSEAKLATRLWGPVLPPGRLVSGAVELDAVEDAPAPPGGHDPPRDEPYLLYLGRIDPGKGCQEMIEAMRLLRERPEAGRLRLVLAGSLQMKLPRAPWLEYAGRVSEATKLQLLKNCLAVVAPSPNESLSFATLEAFAAGRPALVYGGNPVLREHADSGGALAYTDRTGFGRAALQLLRNPEEAIRRGEAGRSYARDCFGRARVESALKSEVRAVIAGARGGE